MRQPNPIEFCGTIIDDFGWHYPILTVRAIDYVFKHRSNLRRLFINKSKQFSHTKKFNVAAYFYLHRCYDPAFTAISIATLHTPAIKLRRGPSMG
jgi:hypothetical protein